MLLPSIYRAPLGKSEHKELVLDPFFLSQNAKNATLGTFRPSPDASRIAFTLDINGDGDFRLATKDLASGRTTFFALPFVNEIEWESNDSLLATQVEAQRASKVYRIRIHPPEESALVFEEPNTEAFLFLSRIPNGKEILLESRTFDSNNLFLISSGGASPQKILQNRGKGTRIVLSERFPRYFLERTSGEFDLLRENRDFSIEKMISSTRDRILTGGRFYNDVLILSLRRGSSPALARFDSTTGEILDLNTPPGCSPSLVKEISSVNTARVRCSSFFAPDAIYDYDPKRNRVTLIAHPSGPDFSEDAFLQEKRFVASRDGEEIPVTILTPKKFKQHGPLLLSAYGAYGKSFDPTWTPEFRMLLESGFRIAIAHVRGGGERGEAWHRAGRARNKINSINDLIDAARTLSLDGHTDALFLEGRSAGGLIVLNAVEREPALFSGAIAEVPFIDTVNGSRLYSNRIEVSEWGDPADSADRRNLEALSPLENLRALRYPPLYLIASKRDTAVGIDGALKFASRVKEISPETKITLRITDDPHEGSVEKVRSIDETAEKINFLLETYRTSE